MGREPQSPRQGKTQEPRLLTGLVWGTIDTKKPQQRKLLAGAVITTLPMRLSNVHYRKVISQSCIIEFFPPFPLCLGSCCKYELASFPVR